MLVVIGQEGGFGSALLREARRREVPTVAHSQGERSMDALQSLGPGARALVVGGLPADATATHLLVDAVVDASLRTRTPIIHLAGLDGLKVIYGVPLPVASPKAEAIDEIGMDGRVANLVEDQFQQHAELSGIPALVLRAGDPFGPGIRTGSVAALLRLARRTGQAVWPAGVKDPHAFAFMDDAADLALRLLDRGWGTFAVAHVPEHIVDGHGWAEALTGAFGRTHAPAPVSGLTRTVRRLWDADLRAVGHRALWDGAILLDDAATKRALPAWAPTPLAEALRRTLAEG